MKSIYKNLDKVAARLRLQFPEAIVRRAWWGEAARSCAKSIEWWFKHKLGFKVVQIAGFINPSTDLCADEVHLNYLGNRIYMDKVFSRVIPIWKSEDMHGKQ